MSSNFDIVFDYRFDASGFFADPERRVILELAASEWAQYINDEFEDIPVGAVIPVVNPEDPTQTESIIVDAPIDDLLIFVGSNDQGGWIAQPDGSLRAQIGEAYSLYNAGDGDAMRLRVATDFRGLGPTTEYEPFVGSIAFNNNSEINWSFDPDGPVAGYSDLFSTAVHEIGHILGLVGSPTYDALITSSGFYGPNAMAANSGSPIPIETDGHVLDGFAGDTVVMDPLELIGVRKLPGSIDLALLADIGYDIDGYVKQGTPFALTTPGNDTPVFGSQADDTINGLEGDDQIQGEGGNDLLFGGEGFDVLFGGSGADKLDGGPDDDQLQGNSGDDVLFGGTGDDDLLGGDGYDTYLFEGNWGEDFVLDLDPSGKLQFIGYSSSDVNLAAFGDDLLISAGSNQIWFSDYYGLGASYDFSFASSADTVREGTDTSASLSEGEWQNGTIDAEPIPGDGPGSQPPASDGQGGSIDKDWYRITLDPDRTYSFDAQSLSLTTGLVFVRLYDSAGNEVGGSFEGEGAAPSFTYSTAGQSGSETQYLAVSTGDTNDSDFRTATGDFRVRFTDEGPITPSTNYSIAPMSQAVDEGNTLGITISRTGDKPEETLFFSTVKGTASYADADYELQGGGLPLNIEVDFASGQSKETVTLDILSNDGIDAGETFHAILQRSPADSAATFVAASGDITITEPSTVTTYDIEPSYLEVVEGGVVTFSIRREGDLSPSTVYASVLDETTDGNDVVYDGGEPTAIEVRFVDGDPVERVVLDAISDNIQEGTERFRVVLHTDANDPEGSELARTDPVSIEDAESGGLVSTIYSILSPATAEAAEKDDDEAPSSKLFYYPTIERGWATEERDQILRDTYPIELEAGTQVQITASSMSPELDTVIIQLYSSEDRIVSNQIGNPAEGDPASTTVTIPETSTYWLHITQGGEKAEAKYGDYEIAVSGPSIDQQWNGSFPQQDGWYNASDFSAPFNGVYHLGEDWNFVNSDPDDLDGEANDDLGRSVYAIGDGQVVFADFHGSGPTTGFGNTVIVEHTVGERTFYALYAHLQDFDPSIKLPDGVQGPVDWQVSAGDRLGSLGDTGFAEDAPHLHFEVLEGDWQHYVASDGGLDRTDTTGRVAYWNELSDFSNDSFTYTEEGVKITWHDPSKFINQLNAKIIEGTDAPDEQLNAAINSEAATATIVQAAGPDVLIQSATVNSTPAIGPDSTILGRFFEKLSLNGSGSADFFNFLPLGATSITNETVFVDGGGGDDVIDAGQIGRRIVAEGGTGNDHVIGGDQNDLLRGGDNSDVLDGGPGNDTMTGGPGDDVFVKRPGESDDTITD
ncbi:peptidoglycan DD-metalloendopeptidase family protein, partial [Roseovarius sp. D22-M7]|uniref:peptidoglycan DD-metalloendopeptidase family protein n=1 Tax=Roseovarius sp. D22-M7 TaxID=3127116 RepID=UPI00300FD41B